MMNRTIVINPVEPSPLSIRAPLGIDLDLGITFLGQNRAPVDPDTLKPQLVLLQRGAFAMAAYDVETSSSEAGIGTVTVPGQALFDPAGYNVELYQRREAVVPSDPPVPIALLAKGVLRLESSAYKPGGQLSPITVPVVVGPQGPQGERGDDGQRGSLWFTGEGDPTDTADKIDGDMYLNTANGDVWRFDGEIWVLGHF